MAEPRVKLPEKIRKGEPFEIKTLITHPMESGQRKDDKGGTIPRMIVNRFVCRLDGEEVFSADLAPAIAANPYLSFFAVAQASGKIAFEWIDDAGKSYTQATDLKVD